MFGNTIAKRVAAVIKERVRVAQERYDAACSQIDHDCAVKIEQIYTEQVDQKEKLADDLVKSVIG